MKSIMEIDSIRKNFGSKIILSDVSLQCKTGEIIGIFGRNGSGKTTLFEIIAGISKAEQQFVRVDGKILKKTFDYSKNIQLLPQKHFLPNHLQIKTIIHLICSLENAAKIESNQFIKPFIHRKKNELSGGEQRFIEIMLLLYSDGKFLILDEPFKALSPKLTSLIIDEIIVASQQKGIIITDHDYKKVEEISAKYFFLKDGFLKSISSLSDIKKGNYIS